ncbi:hypothetical protein PtA15_4A382 [Puccinia triticina]|uniref:Uncharacterized protein n=1 Tax=Puccinia triticina TaxID=208348 RepID=A0ABY7CHI5_9BASI|nr:uncharacterized protein PtA15_4A382 [Puccinia triticina]WAQ83932.1 hypothetical protein PtA15_4A382 [Puccinia triticina]
MYESTTDPLETPPPHISTVTSIAIPALAVTWNAKPRSDDDTEALTWWLDVFGIHPLTTEDILMQETREKIELFRNYHLACFRSFNQDPYSPTYLKPLNIYIIVFCEGTLSYSYLQFPPFWKEAGPLQLLHLALVPRLFWIRHVQSISPPHP